MDLDWRHFSDGQQLIVVKIALFDSALVEGDLRLEGTSQPPCNSSFHRATANIGIERNTAVECACDSMNRDFPTTYRKFDNMSGHRAERLGKGDAAKMSWSRLLSPVAFFRGKIENADSPGVARQQIASIQIRILLRAMCKFVNEALDGKQVWSIAGRAKY